MKWIECQIESTPDKKEWQKWQLRPFEGWPNGIDPYPVASDEDVVMIQIFGYRVKVIGRCVMEKPPAIGDAISHPESKAELHVDRCEWNTMQPNVYQITAVGYDAAKDSPPVEDKLKIFLNE